jgi:hypothetical protein
MIIAWFILILALSNVAFTSLIRPERSVRRSLPLVIDSALTTG